MGSQLSRIFNTSSGQREVAEDTVRDVSVNITTTPISKDVTRTVASVPPSYHSEAHPGELLGLNVLVCRNVDTGLVSLQSLRLQFKLAAESDSDFAVHDFKHLSDGTSIYINYQGDRLYRLDDSYTVTDIYKLYGEAWFLCETENQLVAIQVNVRQMCRVKYMIQIVRVSSEIRASCAITIADRCTGLVYKDGFLFSGTRTNIGVYKLDGALYRNILLATPLDIASSLMSSRGCPLIHAIDPSGGLISMDTNGIVHTNVSIEPIRKLEFGHFVDACMDESGNIFVALSSERYAYTILKVSRSEVIDFDVIAKVQHRDSSPVAAISFDRLNNMLAVICVDTVDVIDLG